MEIYRAMAARDLKAIYDIELEAFSVPWSYESLEMELSNEKAIYIVCEIDGCVVGYAGLWSVFEDGYITNIAVSSEYRQRGIGTNLVKHLIKEGARAGLRNFTLEVRKSNTEALLLYRKLMFKERGIRKNFYVKPTEDAVIMWLDQKDISD